MPLDDEQKKLKAVDINTESLKLYVAVTIASVAGLIAYHNSSNISHNELWFSTTLVTFILCACTSVATINSYISVVDGGIIDVGSKLPVILNLLSISLFVLGLIFGSIYFIKSKPKQDSPEIFGNAKGISIHGNDIIIGPNVKTKVKITKDSCGIIREILILD